jgi:sugar phosphate isomerase/epimerase
VSTSDGTAAPARRIERIGLQLYTVRAEMARDVEATLARVAQIGYTEVEFAGYFKQPPHVIRALLAKNGLTAPAAHIPYATLTGDWQKALDDSATIGHQYVVIPFLDEPTRSRPDGWSRLADEFNRAARLAQAAGLKFAYHNHQFEFVDLGRTSPFDILLEKCDPALVGFELDLFWATVGGQDPVQLFERHPGRFPLVHVKDMIAMPPRQEGELMVPSDRAFTQLTDVGRGSIDWARIFARSTVAGIRHYFVEHDHPTAAFDSIANSFRYLREVRY